MNRREFIKTTTTALAYTAYGRAVLADGDTKRDDGPNILFIIRLGPNDPKPEV